MNALEQAISESLQSRKGMLITCDSEEVFGLAETEAIKLLSEKIISGYSFGIYCQTGKAGWYRNLIGENKNIEIIEFNSTYPEKSYSDIIQSIKSVNCCFFSCFNNLIGDPYLEDVYLHKLIEYAISAYKTKLFCLSIMRLNASFNVDLYCIDQSARRMARVAAIKVHLYQSYMNLYYLDSLSRSEILNYKLKSSSTVSEFLSSSSVWRHLSLHMEQARNASLFTAFELEQARNNIKLILPLTNRLVDYHKRQDNIVKLAPLLNGYYKEIQVIINSTTSKRIVDGLKLLRKDIESGRFDNTREIQEKIDIHRRASLVVKNSDLNPPAENYVRVSIWNEEIGGREEEWRLVVERNLKYTFVSFGDKEASFISKNGCLTGGNSILEPYIQVVDMLRLPDQIKREGRSKK